MKNKIDREQRLKAEITRNTTTIHRVIKTIDGPASETRQVLYCGHDRREARRIYHLNVCNKNETLLNEVVFDSGTDNFKDDAVVPTFSVKWSAR